MLCVGGGARVKTNLFYAQIMYGVVAEVPVDTVIARDVFHLYHPSR